MYMYKMYMYMCVNAINSPVIPSKINIKDGIPSDFTREGDGVHYLHVHVCTYCTCTCNYYQSLNIGRYYKGTCTLHVLVHNNFNIL